MGNRAHELIERHVRRDTDLHVIAQELRTDFGLSPSAIAVALTRHGFPLGDVKLAVDSTLSGEDLRLTEEIRGVAAAALDEE